MEQTIVSGDLVAFDERYCRQEDKDLLGVVISVDHVFGTVLHSIVWTDEETSQETAKGLVLIQRG